MPPGKVYLVGAGPGTADLLTRRAQALLESADLILYDRLIQPEVLELANPLAERLYVGKTPGDPSDRQDRIHELLLAHARAGRTIVRLKGGDPFMFGRGGEEAEFLFDHGIPFEVVPGVSSMLAAPLRAGIPVTFRGVAASVAFVTGHEANDETSQLDWDALSRVHTLVIAMPLQNIRRIAARLVEHGRPGSTPAAIIQSAFWDGERIVDGTLDTIADVVEQAGIKPPATMVVGEVVRLGRKLATAAPTGTPVSSLP